MNKHILGCHTFFKKKKIVHIGPARPNLKGPGFCLIIGPQFLRQVQNYYFSHARIISSAFYHPPFPRLVYMCVPQPKLLNSNNSDLHNFISNIPEVIDPFLPSYFTSRNQNEHDETCSKCVLALHKMLSKYVYL